ncbi:MAG TPA: hypothetical protein VNM14_14020 [Planctomycetota bacterium]|nr:hypothetical protein [Planctomycetota bacterium]
MNFATLLLALAAQSASAATEAPSSFEDRLKHATGPAQLKQLQTWCTKNNLAEEKKRLQELLSKAAAPPKPAADTPQREAARGAGDQARQVVSDYRDGRAKAVGEEVRKVIAWMKTEKYAPSDARERVTTLVRGLLVDEPADRSALEAELKAVEHAERPGEELKKSAYSFDNQIKSILKKFTGQIFNAVEKCIAAGEAGYAFDLYRFLLQADPENERAHKSLGEQKIDNRWMRPFEQDQWKAGLAWDEKGGWVPVKSRERLDQGEIYDTETKQWGKGQDLDKQHAEVAKPWRMESEHFQLISTADHTVNVKLLARMEAFFLQAFRQYDLFFAGKNASKNASLIFGVVPAKKKLVVNFYRSEQQFKEHANPPTTWAAGFYSGGKHASFFYGGGGSRDFSIELMQHELTHQILGEYSDGGRGGGPWLTEGAAVFLESAEFRNGTLSLGDLKDNRDIADYRRNLRAGQKEHSLKTMLETFGARGEWDQGDISKNYRGAGATVYFLMHFDGGRYRADTIQLLRDAYFGQPRPVEEYFGISVAGLSFLMERFYKECDIP